MYKMADIRNGGWEWLHYDNPDFQVQYRKNHIPAKAVLTDITFHWHDDVEFIYVIKGSAGYYINDTKVIIHAGEGLFVNARQRHLLESTNEDCILYCLIFHPVILCSSEYIASNYVMPILENKELTHVLLMDEVDWQKKILMAIADMQPYAESGNAHMQLMRSVYDIWDGLYQNLISGGPDKEEGNKDLISMKRMTAYIQNNYRNKIKLQDICKAGNVGKTKCNELFATYYNLTPIEYLRNYRIDKGAGLLEITDMSITEIAYETGFTDGSYFTKIFRQQIGCSPQDYRSYGKGMSRYYEQSRYPNIHTGI